MAGLEILPVHGIGDVRPGDDVGALIAETASWLRDGDVVVVTSKIVSKAEGRLADVPTGGPEREAARERIVAGETARLVARRGHTQIVATHHGYVMASAGVDTSNVDRSQLVLLPKDPDSTARSLRAALRSRLGVDVAVIVSDTMGRPWRVGLVDVALGAAGINALRDYRGEFDSYGNELQITQMAVIDELASAAELVKNKYDRVPVVVVRGVPRSSVSGVSSQDGPGAGALVRGAEHDLFSLGTAEARAEGLRAAASLGDADAFADTRVDPAAVARALASVAGGAFVHNAGLGIADGAGDGTFVHIAGSGIAGFLDGEWTPAALVAFGADVQRLRAALAAEGLASRWRPVADRAVDGRRAVGVLEVGNHCGHPWTGRQSGPVTRTPTRPAP